MSGFIIYYMAIDRKIAIGVTISNSNLQKAEKYCEKHNMKMSHYIDNLIKNDNN